MKNTKFYKAQRHRFPSLPLTSVAPWLLIILAFGLAGTEEILAIQLHHFPLILGMSGVMGSLVFILMIVLFRFKITPFVIGIFAVLFMFNLLSDFYLPGQLIWIPIDSLIELLVCGAFILSIYRRRYRS